jgi:hypothetical protein
LIKHVDVIAIALLLGAAALYTEARNLSVLQVVPYKRIELSQTFQRAFRCSRSARAQSASGITRALAVPAPRVTVASE